MKTYTFEVTMFAVVEVEAANKAAAQAAAMAVVESFTPDENFLRGFNDTSADAKIGDVSLTNDDSGLTLTALDGEYL